MRLFKYELYKVVTKKLFWGMLAAALAVNVLALWFLNRPSHTQLPHTEVKEVFDTLRVLPLGQKLSWLQNEIDLADAFQIKENYYNYRAMYAENMSARRGGGGGGASRVVRGGGSGGGGVVVFNAVSLSLSDASDEEEYEEEEEEEEEADEYYGDDWYNNWLRDYVEELEIQYEEARERFGERLDEDLSWWVISARKSLYTAIMNDLTVNTYSAYLDRIDEEAARLLGSAIFGSDPDSFSSRNISKTQEDFEGMRGTEIRYDVNRGVTVLFNSPSSDLIILLLLVVLCIILITDEKDKRLFLIVKSTPKGHIHTILAKLAALAVSITFVSVLVFISGAAFAEYTFGLGDVSRSIQSVPLFFGSTLSVSVAGFMGVYLTAKTIALVCIGIAIMLIAIHAKHSIILMLVTILLAAVNIALSAIPLISGLNILRFLNLYSLIRPQIIFGDYFNLNVLGSPVRVAPVFVVFGIAAFIALAVAVCISYLKKHALESNLDLFKFKKLRLPAKVHTGYKFYEFKKLAFTNKALLILLIFTIIQGYDVMNTREPYLGWGHSYHKEYMLSLQGPLTQEKHDGLIAERQKLDAANAEISRINQMEARGEIEWFESWDLLRPHYDTINSMWGFEEIFERFLYVRDTKHAQFVYEDGYYRLFGLNNPSAGLTAGMWLIAIMILTLSGVFPMEYKTGMYKILNASPRGHADTVRLKLLLSGGTVFVAFIIASLPDLIYTGRYFGFGGIAAPLASLPPIMGEIAFPAAMSGMPILIYLALMLILRLFFFAGIMMMILAISLKVRHNVYAMLISAGILLFPLLMYRFGLELFAPVSALELITANGLFIAPSAFKAVQVLVFLIASAVSGWYVIRRFGKT
ncbi:MAG: hypothetical protein FWD48_03280 [Oscillospiraceae bacterium]|nr:hypothetical protein [Oscillospiraceae bacterium]